MNEREKFNGGIECEKVNGYSSTTYCCYVFKTACGNNAIGDNTDNIEKESPKEKTFKLIELTPDSAPANGQFLDKLIEGKKKGETLELMLCK